MLGTQNCCTDGVPSRSNGSRNAPASTPFDTTGPLRFTIYSIPLRICRNPRSCPKYPYGPLQSATTGVSVWSCRFAPTPGWSTTAPIPCSFRCAAGPIPDSIRIFGVAIAPAAITTSVPARASRVSLPSRQRTPTARPFSISTDSTSAPVFSVIRPVFSRRPAGTHPPPSSAARRAR